jgi:hypothetical protein
MTGRLEGIKDRKITTTCISEQIITINGTRFTDFIQELLKKNEKKLTRSFNCTFRYIDDVLSLNKSSFGDFIDPH